MVLVWNELFIEGPAYNEASCVSVYFRLRNSFSLSMKLYKWYMVSIKTIMWKILHDHPFPAARPWAITKTRVSSPCPNWTWHILKLSTLKALKYVTILIERLNYYFDKKYKLSVQLFLVKDLEREFFVLGRRVWDMLDKYSTN